MFGKTTIRAWFAAHAPSVPIPAWPDTWLDEPVMAEPAGSVWCSGEAWIAFYREPDVPWRFRTSRPMYLVYSDGSTCAEGVRLVQSA